MKATSKPQGSMHHGRNVRRLREMFGLKQEALATALGGGWSQRRVSLLEGREIIGPELLRMVARALKVPEEAVRQFDERAAMTCLDAFAGSGFGSGTRALPEGCHSFNPMERWLEAIAENRALYERLLESEREKVELLKSSNKIP